MTTAAVTPDIFDQLAGKTSPAPAGASAPAAGQTSAAPATTQPDIFDQLASGTYKEPSATSTATSGPSDEEQAFMKANPDYVYLPFDPKFRNRPEGVYPNPSTPGNGWRRDPTYTQAPIDLHLAKHTLEGAALGAAVAGGAVALPAVAEALPSVLPHTIAGVKALGTWASKNPVQAYLVFQVLKELVPGAKKAMGIVQHAPDVP